MLMKHLMQHDSIEEAAQSEAEEDAGGDGERIPLELIPAKVSTSDSRNERLARKNVPVRGRHSDARAYGAKLILSFSCGARNGATRGLREGLLSQSPAAPGNSAAGSA